MYTYVGSAFGPGGLAARVGRHLKTKKRRHWHIDYLRRICRVSAVWYAVDSVHREHDWARILMGTHGSQVPVPGFGASDCHCYSHLVFFRRHPSIVTFRRKIRQYFVTHPVIIQSRFISGDLEKNT